MSPQRPRWLLPSRRRLKIKIISSNGDKPEHEEADSIAIFVMLAFRKSEAPYFFLGGMLFVGPSLCSLFILYSPCFFPYILGHLEAIVLDFLKFLLSLAGLAIFLG
jgi:hypothetical protein